MSIPIHCIHSSVRFVGTSDTIIQVPTADTILQAIDRQRCASPLLPKSATGSNLLNSGRGNCANNIEDDPSSADPLTSTVSDSYPPGSSSTHPVTVETVHEDDTDDKTCKSSPVSSKVSPIPPSVTFLRSTAGESHHSGPPSSHSMTIENVAVDDNNEEDCDSTPIPSKVPPVPLAAEPPPAPNKIERTTFEVEDFGNRFPMRQSKDTLLVTFQNIDPQLRKISYEKAKTNIVVA